jgi:hypothetical protein
MCALLGGCGGAGGSHAGGGGSGERRARTSNVRTAAQAVAFARAVNLTAADVPGFTPSSQHEVETGPEKRLQMRLRRCVGPVQLGGGLAEEQSPSFKLKQDVLDLGVSSEVSVARSAADAARELAAIRGARARSCFSRYLDLLLQSRHVRGAQASPVSIASGTPPAPGASGSFAWRITASFTVDRLRLSLYTDILGFVLGPARVTLVSSGAVRPFPAQVQQRLYALLLARATARAL